MPSESFYEQGLFTYYFHANDGRTPFLSRSIPFGEYVLEVSGNTGYDFFNADGRSVCVVGLCVDSCGELVRGVAEYLAVSCRSFSELPETEARFAGKYVIFYYSAEEGAMILGDATCSLPVTYFCRGETAAASSADLLALHSGVPLDETALQIRKKSEVSQAMPADMTLYEGIRQLLPNYFYSAKQNKAIRFEYRGERGALSASACAEMSVKPIRHITEGYVKAYPDKIICPLTSGYDSRVVLAFLKESIPDLFCYTMRHNAPPETPDLAIPLRMTAEQNVRYRQVGDLEPPEELYAAFDNTIGKGLYSKRTVMLAHTIRTHFPSMAIVNGDIIGQIGKSSLHRDIPRWLATPSYFMCKLHNYSPLAKAELKRWLKEAKKYQSMDPYDAFSVENRLGRWAAQENLIYQMMGIPYLNIFNCRWLLALWTRVPRGQRCRTMLHRELLRLTAPELLKYPFGAERNLVARISKANPFFYYIAGFIKYYYFGLQFRRKRGER